MKPEFHLTAFEERKETIFKWAIEVRGLENSRRIIGDNASKAITELFSAYLHREKRVEEGFQLNHSWFKTESVRGRLPEFPNKEQVVSRMVLLEKLCEELSYGAPKPVERAREAVELFKELESIFREMLK